MPPTPRKVVRRVPGRDREAARLAGWLGLGMAPIALAVALWFAGTMLDRSGTPPGEIAPRPVATAFVRESAAPATAAAPEAASAAPLVPPAADRTWWETAFANQLAWFTTVRAPANDRTAARGAPEKAPTRVPAAAATPPAPLDLTAAINAALAARNATAPRGSPTVTAPPTGSRPSAATPVPQAGDVSQTSRRAVPTATPSAEMVAPSGSQAAMIAAPARPIHSTPRNGQNKWGIGIYRDAMFQLSIVEQSKPGVILLMDPSFEFAQAVRRAAPNAFIVGRTYLREDRQPLDRPTERGTALADQIAVTAVPLKGVVDAWMSYNEVLGSRPSTDYIAYGQLQVAFARRLQGTYGISAVAGNNGSGAIEPHDYPLYLGAAIRESDYLGIHAYSPPATRDMRHEADWNALRYRKIHQALENAGIRGTKMVITESGLGDGFGPVRVTDEEMAEQFAWFTRELQRDPYMIGHAAFGLFNLTGDWAGFELTGTKIPDLVRSLLGPP